MLPLTGFLCWAPAGLLWGGGARSLGARVGAPTQQRLELHTRRTGGLEFRAGVHELLSKLVAPALERLDLVTQRLELTLMLARGVPRGLPGPIHLGQPAGFGGSVCQVSPRVIQTVMRRARILDRRFG
jgi:hypothetical protein